MQLFAHICDIGAVDSTALIRPRKLRIIRQEQLRAHFFSSFSGNFIGFLAVAAEINRSAAFYYPAFMRSYLRNGISEESTVVFLNIGYDRQYRSFYNICGIKVAAHSALNDGYVAVPAHKKLKCRSCKDFKLCGLFVHFLAYGSYITDKLSEVGFRYLPAVNAEAVSNICESGGRKTSGPISCAFQHRCQHCAE